MKYFAMFEGIGGFTKGIEQAYEKRHNDYQYESANTGQTDSISGRVGNINKQNNGVLLADNTPFCVGYSEIDRNAIAIYKYHYPGHTNYGDATRIIPGELPDFDLLTGGFPCQSFSIAGKRLGFEDTRGTLFFEIARILEAKKPKHFLLENVKGLFSADEGRIFRTIIGTLTDIGYCVEWDCLNSKFYGVLQNRERVFIVGHLGRLPGREVFPIEESYEQDFTVGRTGQDIAYALDAGYAKGNNDLTKSRRTVINSSAQEGLTPKIFDWNGARNDGGMSLREHSDGIVRALKQSQSGTSTPMVEVKVGTLRTHNDGKGFREMEDGNCRTIPARAREDGSGQPVIQLRALNDERQGNRIYDGEGLAATITANPAGGTKLNRYQVENRIRRMTPMECERLQGFEDSWTKYGIDEKGEKITMSDSARYKALGNAVTTNVITAIISKMIDCCD
jgi:DNA (cytosine-5)-methyltransferase 1